MPNAKKLTIEVVYGLPDKQSLLSVDVAADYTVEEAINSSGILDIHNEIDLSINKVGIWNRVCKLDAVLREGDRIEIYRPLIADPKEVRKRRAEKAKAEGRADKITGGKAKAKG